jgi:two-component system OmpR family sensor kinase
MAARLPIALMPMASIVFAVCAIAGAAWIVLTIGGFSERLDGAQTQLHAMREVDGAAGRYGRQVVDQLLFGYDRSGPLQTARNDMERVLANLTRATRAEMHTVLGSADLQTELPELEQVRRMVDTYHEIDAAATRAFHLGDEGDPAGAREVISRGVDFRLTNELQPLLSKGIADEEAEISGKLTEFEDWRRTAVLVGATVGLLMLATLLLLWLWVHRAVTATISGLVGEATAAIGEPGLPTRADVSSLAVAVHRLASSMHSERLSATTDRAEAAHAHERIRNLNEARGKLLADVGHQLRTPLTVLRGEADVALRGEGNSAALLDSMTRIRSQAAELGHLLEDFIEAARQADEPRSLNQVPLRIDDVVADAADEASVLVDSREITLDLDLAAGGEVTADFRALKQAVMIGLDNAIKHSPPGGTINVSSLRNGGVVSISVADRGPGVLEADRPHVFERFYRGSQEDDLLNPGFGIGLSIAKDIVERHQGTVSLENRPEGGAIFTISLPAIRPES